ncbi:CamS family sex pheromone protein [Bacillus sp. P14.5]|uniref:CamS family sex pheromone protein n=1 Tax=Bacillus sp. P14.5 TaxID=1983400 RepID=UPI000DE9C379|nr:CamS family sex pheromone protein [Bacillus sp. P14.5]
MKKWFAAVSAALVLSGCAPAFEKQEQVVEDDAQQSEKAIIPNYQISNDYFKTLLPYESTDTRGMVVNNLQSRYDIDVFESGLVRMAKNAYSTDQYLFKEGQILDQETIQSWLNRKFNSEQLKEKGLEEKDNIGLNPVEDTPGEGKDSPIYLAHVIEHNYLEKIEENKIQLSSVAVGLALNSVSYYQDQSTGETRQTTMSHEEVREQGTQIAEEVINRMREKPELEGVPIMIALYEQSSKGSVTPGSYFAYTNVPAGSSSISEWTSVDEQRYFFPSVDAEEHQPEDLKIFNEFKEKIETYFPNYVGVVGNAFYKDGAIENLEIDIPIQFNGKAETIGFTQYAAELAAELFPDEMSVEIEITSGSGAEALIVLSQQEEPFVHIYE